MTATVTLKEEFSDSLANIELGIVLLIKGCVCVCECVCYLYSGDISESLDEVFFIHTPSTFL